MSAHGTRTRYVAGCVCGPCRAANTDYIRRYRAQRRTGCNMPSDDGPGPAQPDPGPETTTKESPVPSISDAPPGGP